MYQARLNATPAVEAEMSDMMRDFGNMRKEYADLQTKQQESALATNLERQQQGAQFRVIDPPSLPDKAGLPRSLQVFAGGSRRRLGIGGALRRWLGVSRRSYPQRTRPSTRLSVCRCWSRFLPCRHRREIRAARWKPWVAVAATVAVAIMHSGVRCLRLLMGIVNV